MPIVGCRTLIVTGPVFGEQLIVTIIYHALRAHEALSRPDALAGFLEVVHRLFENGIFVGHDRSIRAGILRSPDCCAFPREHGDEELLQVLGLL